MSKFLEGGVIVGDMSISDDATKYPLTYAQAVKGLKKSVVKKSILSRTKDKPRTEDKRFSTMGATATRSVVRFSPTSVNPPVYRASE